MCDVGRPGFGCHGRRRVTGGFSEYLPSARLEVERSLGPGKSILHRPGISPRRTLLGGPSVEPGEIPPGYVGPGTDVE